MRGCDHDVVYSGQINLSQKFAYICRRCGECGWDSRYELSRVNLDEYLRQRVLHGWGGPPPPPRLPTFPRSRRTGADYLVGVALFAFLFMLCALGMISWGRFGSLMPRWASLVGMGLALLSGAACYLGWKVEVKRG